MLRILLQRSPELLHRLVQLARLQELGPHAMVDARVIRLVPAEDPGGLENRGFSARRHRHLDGVEIIQNALESGRRDASAFGRGVELVPRGVTEARIRIFALTRAMSVEESGESNRRQTVDRGHVLDDQSIAIPGREVAVRDALVETPGPDGNERSEAVLVGQLAQSLESFGHVVVADRFSIPPHGVRLGPELKEVPLDAGVPEEMRPEEQSLHNQRALDRLP